MAPEGRTLGAAAQRQSTGTVQAGVGAVEDEVDGLVDEGVDEEVDGVLLVPSEVVLPEPLLLDPLSADFFSTRLSVR
jgi:hypothetical protein